MKSPIQVIYANKNIKENHQPQNGQKLQVKFLNSEVLTNKADYVYFIQGKSDRMPQNCNG
jgi:hypothetical protein